MWGVWVFALLVISNFFAAVCCGLYALTYQVFSSTSYRFPHSPWPSLSLFIWLPTWFGSHLYFFIIILLKRVTILSSQEMGIPVRRLICASNTNNVLTGFIRKGAYNLSGHTLRHTASPAIDILQSSNLERLIFHMSGENPKTVREFYSTLHREGVAAAPKDVGVQKMRAGVSTCW